MSLYIRRNSLHNETGNLICINVPQTLHNSPFEKTRPESRTMGITWVRQLRSGSCHHPTAATNVTNHKDTITSVQWKTLSITKRVWCLYIYADILYHNVTGNQICINVTILLLPGTVYNVNVQHAILNFKISLSGQHT